MLTPAELVWLIAAVAKGDEAAFERLYAATRAKLFGVVLRILRRQDLAEEVIQEAYVKIWNSAGQFNPALSSPITWMASIARNRAIDVVRKKRESSIEEEPAAMEVAADSPDPLARRAARAHDALRATLPSKLRVLGRHTATCRQLISPAACEGG